MTLLYLIVSRASFLDSS